MPKRSRSGRGSEGGAASRRRSSDAGASQGAQASAQAQLQDLSPEIEERLVRSAFRVVMSQHAPQEPATPTDLRDAIGKDYKAAVLEHVIRQAQSRFEALCGFKMVEVQARSSKAYLLQASDELLQQVSASHTTALAPAPGRDAALAGLLSAVVGSIVLAKGEIKKEEFWALMKELGLLENDRDHPKLGNVKEAFVSRRHRLAASRLARPDPLRPPPRRPSSSGSSTSTSHPRRRRRGRFLSTTVSACAPRRSSSAPRCGSC